MRVKEQEQSAATRETSPNTCTSTFPEPPITWRPGHFDHHKLDAFHVAKRALVQGNAIARRLPRGYSKLADQLHRALLSAYLGVAEAAYRTGADRRNRYRCSRGEAGEAAAALEAVLFMELAAASDVNEVIGLLARLVAMLTRLQQSTR